MYKTHKPLTSQWLLLNILTYLKGIPQKKEKHVRTHYKLYLSQTI